MKRVAIILILFIFICTLVGANENIVYIGDPNSTGYSVELPADFMMRFSISQMIYLDNEIESEGLITHLGFRCLDIGNIPPNVNVRIYLARTNLSAFSTNTSWIPYNQFILVYDGPFPRTLGEQGHSAVRLDNSFFYNTGNLAVMVNKYMAPTSPTATIRHQLTNTVNANRNLVEFRNNSSFNPADLPSGRLRANIPNIVFIIREVGNLEGTVTHEGLPLAEVEININGTNFTAVTNGAGFFRFVNTPSGTIKITATKEGFYDYVSDEIEIKKNETTPHNISMEIMENSETDVSALPFVAALHANFPNPFNPETTVMFTISSDLPVQINIYNIRGQRVKSLVNDLYETGSHKVVWNGTDDSGKRVCSGIYFYRMTAGEFRAVNKMLLLK